MILLHVGIAIRGFDAPESEHYRARHAVVLLDTAEERGLLLRLFLAGRDAPVGDAPVEILPDLLVKLGLVAHLRENGVVGREPVHHARIGRIGNAALLRSRAKRFDPAVKRRAAALRPGRIGRRQHSDGARDQPH
jgi:hypothetical protein